MPRKIVDITTDIVITPRDVAYPRDLVILGLDGAEFPEDEDKIIELSDSDEIENADLEDWFEDELKGALEQGISRVFAIPVEYDTTEETDDIGEQVNWDTIEEQISSQPTIAHTGIADDGLSGVDDIDDVYSTLHTELLQNGLSAVTVWPVDDTGDDADTTVGDVSSSRIMTVAHKFDDDYAKDRLVGAMNAAALKVPRWDKLMWKKVMFDMTDEDFDMPDRFTTSRINDLEDDNINVLMYRDGDFVFSNGLALADDDIYKYIDVIRTQDYIESEIERQLANRIGGGRVPFTSEGIGMIENRLLSVLSDLTDEDIIVTGGYRVDMPTMNDVTADDKVDRLLKGIEIECRLQGHIQEIKIDMTLKI